MIEEKEGENRNLFILRGFLIILSILFSVFLLIALFYGFSSEVSKKILVCGDGTPNGFCSSRMPYFCEDGLLIENANLCACPGLLKQEGNLCVSEYETSPENITLNYVLRGNEGRIAFQVYGGMVDYLGGLSRSIHYGLGEEPSRRDFKLRDINEEEQRELLLPLVTKIQNIAKNKNDQMRIAVSLVQEIPFGQSNKTVSVVGKEANYTRYPYEVLYEGEGVCGEKSELLLFLLKEMGYGVSLFYYGPENHEAVGIKCPLEYSVDESGYCFIETSGASIIANDRLEYARGVMLESKPEIILISDGETLGDDLYEYEDSEDFIHLDEELKEKGKLGFFENLKLKKLNKKYGLAGYYNI